MQCYLKLSKVIYLDFFLADWHLRNLYSLTLLLTKALLKFMQLTERKRRACPNQLPPEGCHTT